MVKSQNRVEKKKTVNVEYSKMMNTSILSAIKNF